MNALLLFLVAAVLEIAGCFAFWQWHRADRSALWLLPGVCALAGFAAVLARAEVAFAGRAFAAYGGVYILAALAWLWIIEGKRPDFWDVSGGALCLSGTLLILLAPRV